MVLPRPLTSCLFVFFTCVLSSILTQSAAASSFSNFTDAAALLAFKASVTSDPNSFLVSWGLSTDVCSWDPIGVICSKEQRVVELNLLSGSLEGYISSAISNLTELEVLNLAGNYFHGVIPSTITSLSKLQSLTIDSGGNLTGGIPADIGKLSSLVYLDLSGNNFEGTVIPDSIGNLTKLQTLILGSNIGGSIPVSLTRLSALQTLTLSDTLLTGVIPPEISSLSNLTSLTIMYSKLGGSIPESIGKLSKLQTVKLVGCNFSGSVLPESLINLTQLRELMISDCAVGGPLLPGLASLKYLDSLELALNRLEGPIPVEFSKFMGTTLDLATNRLNGTLPDLGGMKNMRFLYLMDNNLTGPLPLWVLKLNATLLTLDLSENDFYGPIPASYQWMYSNSSHCVDLSEYGFYPPIGGQNNMDLSGNRLNGSIPPELGNLLCLGSLNLNDNLLTGTIPASLSKLSQLVNFNLSNNLLSGPIPDMFSDFYLESIDLSFNFLSGPLPPSFTPQEQCNMKVVKLSNNLLTGNVSQIIRCKDFIVLDLSSNQFSGAFPAIDAPGMYYLDVSINRFNGPLPSTIKSFIQLKYLDLSNNLFHGSIPYQLFTFANLTLLDCSKNRINGSLPNIPANSSITPMVYLDLSSNLIPGGIPPSFQALRDTLTFLYLHHNFLNASLPSSLGNLTYLHTLSLSHNNIPGTIPDSFGNLTSLSKFTASSNRIQGKIPPSLGFLETLTSLDLSHNSISSAIPDSFRNLSSIVSIDLSNNQLAGPLPDGMGYLVTLSALNLVNNSLTGPIPPTFSSLSALSSFNVSYNNLTGQIPAGNLTKFNESSYLSNSGLCGGPLLSCPSPDAPPSSLTPAAIGGISAGAAFVLFVLIAGLGYLILKNLHGDEEGEFFLFQKVGAPLNMRIIMEATDNFSPKKVLGQGGFGAVYKVTLKDGMELAVKRLFEGAGQGLQEVKNEMKTLGRVKHKNLVTLVGAFIGKKEALLIYEFLPGGDLENRLFNPKKANMFTSWPARLTAILDSARGLKYLHHDCPGSIIHRDIKPPNILFDADSNAKVADFGLAKEINLSEQTHLSTSVSGTIGYLAPEYATSGKLTPKSDVFAFGVVVLQVLSGKRPGEESLGDYGLAKWVHKTWKEKSLAAVLDPQMKYEASEEDQVIGALRLGLMCASKGPNNRPTMDEVVYLLENLDIFDDQNAGSVISESTTDQMSVQRARVEQQQVGAARSFGGGNSSTYARSQVMSFNHSGAYGMDSNSSMQPIHRPGGPL